MPRRRSRSYGEPDKPSGLVNHRHELGGKPASTTADSLPLSRFLRRATAFFAPTPCWWTLAKVPSTITVFKSRSSSTTSKSAGTRRTAPSGGSAGARCSSFRTPWAGLSRVLRCVLSRSSPPMTSVVVSASPWIACPARQDRINECPLFVSERCSCLQPTPPPHDAWLSRLDSNRWEGSLQSCDECGNPEGMVRRYRENHPRRI